MVFYGGKLLENGYIPDYLSDEGLKGYIPDYLSDKGLKGYIPDYLSDKARFKGVYSRLFIR